MTDFTNFSEMPEWPKQMACDKANARGGSRWWQTTDIPRVPVLTELALMCWQFCEEPVDPDLLIAREAVAQVCERAGVASEAARYRSGKLDSLLKDGAAIIAARLAREQGAK